MDMLFDSNPLNDISDRITEVDLAVERLQAVTQSFMEDYVDEVTDPKKAEMYIGCRFDHFCRLAHTIAFMIADIENMTKALEDKAAKAISDRVDLNKPTAGVR